VDFFGDSHVVIQLSLIGLFGIKRAYLHLEKPKLQELFLSKINSIFTGKQYARCSFFYHRWFSFERYMCFFNLAGFGTN
jgi:hypothetical protein